jgi:hypothetical protein
MKKEGSQIFIYNTEFERLLSSTTQGYEAEF